MEQASQLYRGRYVVFLMASRHKKKGQDRHLRRTLVHTPLNEIQDRRVGKLQKAGLDHVDTYGLVKLRGKLPEFLHSLRVPAAVANENDCLTHSVLSFALSCPSD
jgi:hypothetical protein